VIRKGNIQLIVRLAAMLSLGWLAAAVYPATAAKADACWGCAAPGFCTDGFNSGAYNCSDAAPFIWGCILTGNDCMSFAE